jgi:acetyl esterase/lipase
MFRSTMIWTAMTIALSAATPAHAQTSPMPSDIAAKLIELGRTVDPERTALLYAPLQQKEPYAGVKVTRDIKYGPAERHLLDLFVPEDAGGARPVLMFVHGGGFVRGGKRMPGSPFYDNIMLWAARNGMIGVNMTYRLAPQSPWPAGAEDVAAGVRWVADTIARHGGDQGHVFLMGHSAGATHVASYVAFPQFHGPKGTGLAGAVMTSGIYDLTKMQMSDGGRAYFGSDPARHAERSALAGLLASTTPLLLAAAELDPPQFVDQLDAIKAMLCKRERGCARTLLLPQHSHMSEVYAINTADTRLSAEVLDFIRTAR